VYDEVEGDSASAAELYALLSALSDSPIQQGIAVTGSMNQLGEVQAIGAVNEKIEGFFLACRTKGLTGEQGVIIPQANVKHLMLRKDVVKAVDDGKFSIWAVSTVDEGIEILTGLQAGEPDARGRYPEGTVYRRCADRLLQLSRSLAAQGRRSDRGRLDGQASDKEKEHE
jgi:predicted ATP-dependent protease